MCSDASADHEQATGRVGGYFAAELAKTGKHAVTALVREESKGEVPAGVETARVNFGSEDSLVAALKGQQVLIITLPVRAPEGLHGEICRAAAKAGVSYIMPNAWGGDVQNKDLAKGALWSPGAEQRVADVANTSAAWIGMCCGFWYEWSLALGEQWYGFDIKNKKVTFFDDGTTKISSSTWNQCGKAVAALLSLPQTGASPCLADYKNKFFYIDSFVVSQRDMLDSLHRVMNTTDKDWEITSEPTSERYQKAHEEIKQGIFTGFPKAMYTRVFFRNGGGDFTYRGLSNDVLGLPKDDLDAATKRAVDMSQSGWNPFA